LGAWLIRRAGTPHGAGAQPARHTGADVPVARRPLRQATAWAVTAFFGLQAMLYFAVTSWLAVFLVANGWASGDAAALLAWFSVAGLPASLLTPVLAGRKKMLAVLAPGIGVAVAAALIGVLTAPAEWQFLMVGVLGIVQSAGFGLGMALVVIRSDGPRSAGSLSAMSQGLGFAFASVGPFITGLLHQWSGSWTLPFSFMATGALLLAGAGFFAIRGPVVSVGETESEPAVKPVHINA
ncbi:MAG: MFS transporter, partial [Actinomycetes bacterium]